MEKPIDSSTGGYLKRHQKYRLRRKSQPRRTASRRSFIGRVFSTSFSTAFSTVFMATFSTALITAVMLFSLGGCSTAPRRPDLVHTIKNRAAEMITAGNRALQAGRYSEALTLYTLSLETNRSIDHLPGMIESHNSRGKVYFITGNSEMAWTEFEKALSIAELTLEGEDDASRREREQRLLGKLRTKVNMAEVLLSRGEPEEAYALLDGLHEIAPNRSLEQAMVLHAQAMAVRRLGRTQDAVERLEAAKAINIRNKSHIYTAANFYSLASIYSLQDDYETAVEMARQALRYDKKAENSIGIGADLHALGLIHRKFGSHQKSRDYFQRAYWTYSSMRDYGEAAQVVEDLLSVLERMQAFDEAEEWKEVES